MSHEKLPRVDLPLFLQQVLYYCQRFWQNPGILEKFTTLTNASADLYDLTCRKRPS